MNALTEMIPLVFAPFSFKCTLFRFEAVTHIIQCHHNVKAAWFILWKVSWFPLGALVSPGTEKHSPGHSCKNILIHFLFKSRLIKKEAQADRQRSSILYYLVLPLKYRKLFPVHNSVTVVASPGVQYTVLTPFITLLMTSSRTKHMCKPVFSALVKFSQHVLRPLVTVLKRLSDRNKAVAQLRKALQQLNNSDSIPWQFMAYHCMILRWETAMLMTSCTSSEGLSESLSTVLGASCKSKYI